MADNIGCRGPLAAATGLDTGDRPHRPHPARRLRGDLAGRAGRRRRCDGGARRPGHRTRGVHGGVRHTVAAVHRDRGLGGGDRRRGAAAAAGAPRRAGGVAAAGPSRTTPGPCAGRRSRRCAAPRHPPRSCGCRGRRRLDGRPPGYATRAAISPPPSPLTTGGWTSCGCAAPWSSRSRDGRRDGGDRRRHLPDGRRQRRRGVGVLRARRRHHGRRCPRSRGSTCASCARSVASRCRRH